METRTAEACSAHPGGLGFLDPTAWFLWVRGQWRSDRRSNKGNTWTAREGPSGGRARRLPRDPMPSLAAFLLHGWGPTGEGSWSCHIFVAFIPYIHDVPLPVPCQVTCGLDPMCTKSRKPPPRGSCHEASCVAWGFPGLRSWAPHTPRSGCRAEPISGKVARSLGDPAAKAGPLSKLLLDPVLGWLLASLSSCTAKPHCPAFPETGG